MALAGKNAIVKLGATSVLEINDANVTLNGENLDSTVFESDGWRERLRGLTDATFTISGFYDPTDTTGQVALRTASLTGAVVDDFTFLADKGSATSGFTSDVLVSSFETGASVGDLVSVSISVESTGEVALSS